MSSFMVEIIVNKYTYILVIWPGNKVFYGEDLCQYDTQIVYYTTDLVNYDRIKTNTISLES